MESIEPPLPEVRLKRFSFSETEETEVSESSPQVGFFDLPLCISEPRLCFCFSWLLRHVGQVHRFVVHSGLPGSFRGLCLRDIPGSTGQL